MAVKMAACGRTPCGPATPQRRSNRHRPACPIAAVVLAVVLLLKVVALSDARPSIMFDAVDDASAADVGRSASLLADERTLPRCSRSLVMDGRVMEEQPLGVDNDDVGQLAADVRRGHTTRGADDHLNVTSSAQFFMSLKETVCIVLKSNKTFADGVHAAFTIMHTVEYVRLEHHYGISGKYKFAVPLLSQQCKCDCAGGEQICSIDSYQYRNCTPGSVCYRTYFGNQANTGCLTGGKSEVCCQIRIEPYRDWSFQAVRLRQPDTALVLRYRIFEQAAAGLRNAQKWRNTVDDEFSVPLNQGVARFELNNEHVIQIVAGGSRPHRQMEPGMYFWQMGASDDGGGPQLLRGGVPLNEPAETSLDKLGWLRWEDGRWSVRKGIVKITQAQHINVQDCKAQRYTTNFNAEQYVSRAEDGDVTNFDLGTPVVNEPWVAAVHVADARTVRVEHAEGVGLMIAIKTESRPRIVHHASQFTDFNGTIQLDRESNRYMNLTFLNARGTLIGHVYSSDARVNTEIVFSVQTADQPTHRFRAIVALPASVGGQRLTCVHPSDDYDSQVCHWLPFEAIPIQEYRVANQWQPGRADCAGCNERGVDSLVASLDPRAWFDGLNSPVEMFTCVTEIVLCIGAILLAIVTFTKCIIPLFRCVRSIARPPKNKR